MQVLFAAVIFLTLDGLGRDISNLSLCPPRTLNVFNTLSFERSPPRTPGLGFAVKKCLWTSCGGVALAEIPTCWQRLLKRHYLANRGRTPAEPTQVSECDRRQ
ncbi:hypothetical protein BOTBODRAFT_273067 [Botryobasidium botryosum FD-172 SS1]|uniref:Secreted protein n=1 Tax=Botryobasidium botryosum (strain FD-172 SS1) TaxID=930990 RepID=A0A067MWA6_BOTB1|nr:hypothetical protein BOTBODRAFT_273067 [Botryobasidium botryosum FD-172 SS1]